MVRALDVFGERSVDDTVFSYAVEQGRVLASNDKDCLRIAHQWLEQGRAFRLVYWPQRKHQRTPVAAFLQAFDELAARKDAFAASIEYLRV